LSHASETIRAFIAIELPGDVKGMLSDVCARFSGCVRGAKWVRPEGMHLTLKFLGDIASGQVESIGDALGAVAQKHVPFSLSIGSAGVFPSPKKARVLWAGVDDPGESCRKLAADADAALGALGFEQEKRPFSPHLTLARLRDPAPAPREFLDAKFEPVRFDVTRFVLFRSRLQPSGAVYTPLKEFHLKKG